MKMSLSLSTIKITDPQSSRLFLWLMFRTKIQNVSRQDCRSDQRMELSVHRVIVSGTSLSSSLAFTVLYLTGIGIFFFNAGKYFFLESKF